MRSAGANRWPAAIELVRPSKPIAAALFTLLGAYLAAPPAQVLSAPALVAAAVVFLVTAFGFVVNDCYDIEVDRLGKPYRPIPSGRVSSRGAVRFAALLAAAALALSASLGWSFALIALGAVALSWGYSYRLKSTLLFGNAAVALLVVASLLYGALAAGTPGAAVWTAAAISFPYIVAQEALFNLEDEDEDRAAGLQTTATRLGVDGTASLIRAVLGLFILAAVAPVALGPASSPYVAAALFLLVLPATFFIYLLRAPVSRVAVASAARLSRMVWAASFVPLALLGCGTAMAASTWDDARAVTQEELVLAMQAQQRLGYALDAPSNAARLQACVLLALAGAAEAGGSQRPLRVGHEEYFRAFLQVTGHTPASAPKFVSVAHRHGEDFLIDYRRENVIASIQGAAPKRALNVKAGWPPGAGSPSSYSYEDQTSDPHVEITHEQRNGYRILDFGDAVVYDDMYGIRGRVTSGLMGFIFRFLGTAEGVQTRFAVAPDGTQVSFTTVRKGWTVTQTVTTYPDGKVLPNLPEDRPDLQDLEARLIKLDFVVVYKPRDGFPMPVPR